MDSNNRLNYKFELVHALQYQDSLARGRLSFGLKAHATRHRTCWFQQDLIPELIVSPSRVMAFLIWL